MSMISGKLQSYSDICDALSVTEVTLGFLAMAGEDGEMPLTDYIEKVLQMGDQTNPHVLQVSPEGKAFILRMKSALGYTKPSQPHLQAQQSSAQSYVVEFPPLHIQQPWREKTSPSPATCVWKVGASTSL